MVKPLFWSVKLFFYHPKRWISPSSSRWSAHSSVVRDEVCGYAAWLGKWYINQWIGRYPIFRQTHTYIYMYMYYIIYIYICIYICTSSTAQGGGGSFKNRKPIGEVGGCESGMAERSHWCLRSPLFLSLSLTIYLCIYVSMYLCIYVSMYLSTYLSIYRSVYLSM